jgi:molybdate transport repressor ModE-like protein
MAYDLNDLQLFLEVVDHGSITQGAKHSHMSLASASARVSAMEKALGAPLLTRHRRGVVPSQTGWVLVAHARAIVAEYGRMRAELTRLSDGLRATLVVLANTSACETLLPVVMAEFLSSHTDIDVDLQQRASHEVVAAVTDGRAEVGIIADTVDSGSLMCVQLREDPLVAITARDHALAARNKVSFSACLDFPFLGLAGGSPLQEHLSGQTVPLGLRPRYRARLPSFEAVVAAVAAGVGIAVVPAYTSALMARPHDVATIELTNSWANRNLMLCHRSSSSLSAAANALIAYLAPGSGSAVGRRLQPPALAANR